MLVIKTVCSWVPQRFLRSVKLLSNRLIWQQDGNVIRRRESARKGLNSTFGAQFSALPLVKPVFDLRPPSSNDVPVLLLNQPNFSLTRDAVCVLKINMCEFFH